MNLRAPFPWFGGKSRCADLVWERFGDVPNYVEPFFGSGAILLARDQPGRTETVNDKDCYLANFWRAVQHDPEAVARYADWPVNEADLHARHRWLVSQSDFRHRLMHDPHYFDARIAGYWVWGISQWIGSGWCARPEWLGRTLPGRSPRGILTDKYAQRPSLTKRGGVGVNRVETLKFLPDKRPRLSGWSDTGVHKKNLEVDIKRPCLKRGAKGVNAKFLDRRMPDLGGNSGATGKGILRTSMQLPQLSGDGSGNGRGILRAGSSGASPHRNVTSRMGQWQTRPFLTNGQGVQCDTIRSNLVEYMFALQDRLRRVRVCCGDWQRVLGPSPTTCIGLTGIFLDPPYSGGARRAASIYNHDCLELANEVRRWAIAHGNDPKLRIALCGYEGEHRLPKGWTCVAWKANGGYGNQAKGRGRANAGRERIWFSPYCLRPEKLKAEKLKAEIRISPQLAFAMR